MNDRASVFTRVRQPLERIKGAFANAARGKATRAVLTCAAAVVGP